MSRENFIINFNKLSIFVTHKIFQNNFGRKHPQFRDGKINFIIKKEEIVFILDALGCRDQRVNEIEPTMKYLCFGNTD